MTKYILDPEYDEFAEVHMKGNKLDFVVWFDKNGRELYTAETKAMKKMTFHKYCHPTEMSPMVEISEKEFLLRLKIK